MMVTADSVKNELDVLEPPVENRNWTFTDINGVTQTYIQKPLSFFGKVEFFSLVGDTIDSLSDEGKPLNVTELFGASANMDSLIAVVSRVASHAPEALKEAYCIFLSVPRNERVWAKARMDEELTDDQGMEILEIFVDQNADDLRSFFDQKGKSLLAKIQKRFVRSVPAPSSKRTKRTPQSTPETA